MWELGFVSIAGYVPDYPSSDENRLNGIILPYIIYRGEFIRAGDKGIVRGRLLRSDRLELDLSLDGSFDSDSDKNLARTGMPDLDYLFEFGPRLEVSLMDSFQGGRVELEIPLRAVISTDFSSLSFEGVVLHPQVAWQHENLYGTGTEFKICSGPIFATEGFMDYFFEVPAPFASPTRRLYNAQGGYLGSEIRISAVKKLNDLFSIVGDIKANFYNGSRNDDSPLFRDDFTSSVRIGFICTPFKSSRKVSD